MLALLLALAVATTATSVAPTTAPTHLDWPAQGTVTTPFSSSHPGIDIGILRSLAVRAATPGRVKLVGDQQGYEGYGKIVLVDVGGGYETLYAHLSRVDVRAGMRVWRDEHLGTAGCTGWCTGTHLHFELRLRGRAVSPFRIPLG